LIKAFGAPIAPADAKTIGDYLKQNYGGEAVSRIRWNVKDPR
jgi:hypothetical protein